MCPSQEKGINLTHIESRPSRKNKEEYEFFISVDPASSKDLDEVVNGLRTQIRGQVHELTRNKQKDTGETQQRYYCGIAILYQKERKSK